MILSRAYPFLLMLESPSGNQESSHERHPSSILSTHIISDSFNESHLTNPPSIPSTHPLPSDPFPWTRTVSTSETSGNGTFAVRRKQTIVTNKATSKFASSSTSKTHVCKENELKSFAEYMSLEKVTVQEYPEETTWFASLLVFEGAVLKQIYVRVLLVVVVTFGLIIINSVGVTIPPVDPIAHSLIGLALGLLLVFRTNSAYDRYIFFLVGLLKKVLGRT